MNPWLLLLHLIGWILCAGVALGVLVVLWILIYSAVIYTRRNRRPRSSRETTIITSREDQ